MFDLIPLALKLIDKFVPDQAAAQQAKLQVIQNANDKDMEQMREQFQLALGQIQTNTAEANSASLFRGGWRPAAGWVCVIAFFYQMFLRPVLPWIVNACGGHVPQMVDLDMGTLMTVLLGMLGLGGLRTKEKLEGLS